VAEEIIVHHGAPITVSGLGKAKEAFLAALVQGEFGVDDDQDTYAQFTLRARMTHAFPASPESIEIARECLEIWDLEPDDGTTRAMVSGWLRELYGALHHFHRQAR